MSKKNDNNNDELSLNAVTAAIMANKKAAQNVAAVAAKLNRTADEIASMACIMACNEIDADRDPTESLEDSVYIDAAIETAKSPILKMLIDNHLLAVKLQAEVEAAKKTSKKAEKTVVLNEIQHALLKDIVARCKVYVDATGTPCEEKIKDETGKLVNNPNCTGYRVEVFETDNMNGFGDIESKIADIVSWFAPNAKKTGKVCTTAADEAASIIREMYISAVAEMYSRLPVDALAGAPVDAPVDALAGA